MTSHSLLPNVRKDLGALEDSTSVTTEHYFPWFHHREATRFIEGCSRVAELELSKVFVDRCKEALDLVDSEITVLEVASVFGE